MTAKISKRSRDPGFTLIEIVIVFGLVALIAALGLPVGMDSYRNYVLTSETRTLVSVLRRAENLALANKFESPHGVSVQSDRFVLFKGSSFVSRDQNYDENYLRSSMISVSSTPEIVFDHISGLVNASATFVLSNAIRSASVIVNEEGALIW